jgi:tetratricopeptide (TPR) repeat protein/transglutaminase-like putative cysteine protease
MTPFRKLAALFTLLAVMAGSLTTASAQTGWTLLAQNKHGAALTAFRAELARNPADTEALRGTVQVALMEDREHDALAALRSLYHLTPAGWAASGYWPQFVELARKNGQWDLLEGAARDILAAKTASTSLRASARLALAEAAARAGHPAVAAPLWSTPGYLRRWQIIGPFENASQSGLDTVYAPELSLAFDQVLDGKDNQKLHWHPLLLLGTDGQCAVGDSLTDSFADAFYAVTAVQSPAEQSVLVHFDPTGSSKVYINGKPVFADALRRSHTTLVADSFVFPASLHAGWNTILVKMGDDDKVTSAFSLRLSTPVGLPLTTLPSDPKQAKGACIPAATDVAPETETARLLRRQPLTIETAGLLGENLRLAHDYPASAEALRTGLALAPDNGWLHWNLAQTLHADGQDDESRSERTQALKDDPHLVGAVLDALADTADSATPAEMITRTRAALASNPSSSDLLWQLARAYNQAKLKPEALKTARQAVVLTPGAGSLAFLVAFLDEQNKKAEAKALLAASLRTAPGDMSLLGAQAERFADTDNSAGGIAVTKQMLARDPANPEYRVTLANLYSKAGQPAAAIASLRIAREVCPQDANTCAALADLLQEGGKSKEALTLYAEAIRLNPSLLTLRERREVLSGEKPVLDLAPATDGAPILAAAALLKTVPEASAVMLLDEARTVVYPDYATLTRFHQIIKILDQSAVARYGQYGLSRSTSTTQATVESARLIKADGKIQDQTDSAEQNYIPFPSLAIGDIIDVTYRVEDYHRGRLAHQFWEQWTFNVANAPSRLSRFVLITPPDMTFQTQDHGTLPEPTIKDKGGWRIREWRMTDVPPLRSELMGTGPTDSALWLDISSVSSWAQIVSWYRDLAAPRCIPDAAIRAKALELTKNAVTETDKIHALEAFVAHEVHYQSSPFRLSAYVPTEGKQVIRERYGDCKDKAALLTSLLAAVGIKADMALLSPRGYGLTPYLPSPRFSHAIARVQTASGPLWVDATADQLTYGTLPPDDQQVPALIIAPDTTALTLTPLLPMEQDRADSTISATLGEDGVLHGSYEWTLTGSQAWVIRSALRQIPDAKSDEIKQSLAGFLMKNGMLDSGSWENLSDPDAPLRFRFQYHIDHDSTSAGSFLLVPLSWASPDRGKAASLLTKTPRTQDLEAANSRSQMHEVLRLTLPTGYVPQEMPTEVHRETPFGSYKVTYQMSGGIVIATRDMLLTAMRIPAKDVAQYAAFLEALDVESQRQLLLKKQ